MIVITKEMSAKQVKILDKASNIKDVYVWDGKASNINIRVLPNQYISRDLIKNMEGKMVRITMEVIEDAKD